MTVERIGYSFFFDKWVARVNGTITMISDAELLKLEAEVA